MERPSVRLRFVPGDRYVLRSSRVVAQVPCCLLHTATPVVGTLRIPDFVHVHALRLRKTRLDDSDTLFSFSVDVHVYCRKSGRSCGVVSRTPSLPRAVPGSATTRPGAGATSSRGLERTSTCFVDDQILHDGSATFWPCTHSVVTLVPTWQGVLQALQAWRLLYQEECQQQDLCWSLLYVLIVFFWILYLDSLSVVLLMMCWQRESVTVQR